MPLSASAVRDNTTHHKCLLTFFSILQFNKSSHSIFFKETAIQICLNRLSLICAIIEFMWRFIYNAYKASELTDGLKKMASILKRCLTMGTRVSWYEISFLCVWSVSFFDCSERLRSWIVSIAGYYNRRHDHARVVIFVCRIVSSSRGEQLMRTPYIGQWYSSTSHARNEMRRNVYCMC